MSDALPIITDRLILRPWEDRDRDAAWMMAQDAEVMRYLASLDRESSDAMIDRMMAMQAQHGHTFWAMERRGDGQFLGMCGFCPPRPPLSEYEIGWRLARTAWGQGYGTESARAVLDWAWTHRNMATIVAITTRENAKSQALMMRIGMAHAPDEDFDHPALLETDRLRPHVLYRIARPKS
ncbi:GNAT family N-acetyltransferase [Novosphingobium sp. SG707]|uniref:GNAT family N-acetyltransferase n=1 Tax=Novosphingobium sp. SG707 TaxID=2586996 RepID=UPI0014460FD0|nr:GNAT family N-acetyltransferase [Novosphingobium sp. SG707]NKJ00070.1 RimJ/RimL family protein N-acetyltransferase [Novosphingobium sp. SG707]